MLQFAVQKFVCRDGKDLAQFSQCRYARFGATLFPVGIATFYDAKSQCDLLLRHSRLRASGF